MKIGWIKISDSKWYYMNSDGSMKTGWLHDLDGNWYNLAPSGEMRTGWILDKDEKVYLAGSNEDPSRAVDNNLTSIKWCSTNSGDKWLTVDLGKSYQIGRWYVRHAGDLESTPDFTTKDFKLQESDDGQDWGDVDSLTGNTLNVTDRNVSSFRARYVRLYNTGRSKCKLCGKNIGI